MHVCYNPQVWRVVFHPEAAWEHRRLPAAEREAIDHAVEKLQAMGPTLPYPHQSDVRAASSLRELRPRAGRSAWRALYRRVGETFIIAAVGPEAEVDPRRFDRAVGAALARLEDLEGEKS